MRRSIAAKLIRDEPTTIKRCADDIAWPRLLRPGSTVFARRWVARLADERRLALGELDVAVTALRALPSPRARHALRGYERAGHGEDFITNKPAIPADAEWLKVYTSPETHIDLAESN
jgi:acyl dehydratase